ncbi:MAG: Trp biosynthesis-associated membrane protein, partial [Actinocatenispora sp.]
MDHDTAAHATDEDGTTVSPATSGSAETEAAATAGTTGSPARRGPSRRGQLALAVLACTLGAVIALYASSKSWAVDVTERPAPLPPVRTARSGGDFVPWVPALALISLAGAGALVATRRIGRVLVGAALTLLGLGVAVAAGYGLSAA